jgi:hypothetical protein
MLLYFRYKRCLFPKLFVPLEHYCNCSSAVLTTTCSGYTIIDHTSSCCNPVTTPEAESTVATAGVALDQVPTCTRECSCISDTNGFVPDTVCATGALTVTVAVLELIAAQGHFSLPLYK